MTKKRVVVGLSGGVDSSVTAKLLIDQGYEVIGVFMKNWDDKDDPHCPAAVDAMDARNVADHLGIPFYSFNFAAEYWRDVFDYFLEQHRLFRTPNPDILCNQFIKFKVFLEAAEKLGADFIATGHYAKNHFNTETGLFELQVPNDANKDQTYFLYTLKQKALAKTLFPLADLPKPRIREIALESGFHNAKKKDSTGICFVGERDHMEFLKKYLEQTPGDIITEKSDVIGKHIGLSFYTIGQRRNLNIGGVKGYSEAPWFVLVKDTDKNQIIVCQNDDNPRLFQTELKANRLSWVSGKAPSETHLTAKIRYRQDFQDCTARMEGEEIHVTFKDPQRAVTPGQSIVFYDEAEKVCLGGGEIC
ncbi:tRNA 2-thiouridine(34) synthase MnmA [bacterium]|nr:tRNA 2-thiouridine(34) synthase MnmA [bacterium]NCQ54822.1 tRNA 2-thiouridine(34) synthase MnmA [Candidatus Parcubacteria bacterium]NCS66866.1 tRNA 2-thiouridine(34) synthase MnmA [Candidatus Peregrinibacteria bacterium]NCS95812.1 tRNA 2-thiouridine(34) synthase MnmA [bacterium]